MTQKHRERLQEMECKIYYLRTDKGMTQKALSKAAGVPQANVHAYENVQVYPRIDNAIRIARALDCKVEDLWQLKDVK